MPRRRAICDPWDQLEQLAADADRTLPRLETVVSIRPVRRRQRHSAEQRVRRAGRERADTAQADPGEDLSGWLGPETQPLYLGYGLLLRAFPERLPVLHRPGLLRTRLYSDRSFQYEG